MGKKMIFYDIDWANKLCRFFIMPTDREIVNVYPVPLELGGHDNVARLYRSIYMLHFYSFAYAVVQSIWITVFFFSAKNELFCYFLYNFKAYRFFCALVIIQACFFYLFHINKKVMRFIIVVLHL